MPCFRYGPERTLPEVRRRAFVDLEPDTAYEARFVMSDPDGFAGATGLWGSSEGGLRRPSDEAQRVRALHGL